MSVKNWKDFLWPLGGTLLSLLVMPIAITQYPQFFNENTWVLPISIVAVLLCWIIPLLLHDRTREIYSSIVAIPRYGYVLFGFVCLAAVVALVFGGAVLFGFHSNHLKTTIAQNQELTSGKPVSPSVMDAIPKPMPSSPAPEVKKSVPLKKSESVPTEISSRTEEPSNPEKPGTVEILPPTTGDVHVTVKRAPTQTATATVIRGAETKKRIRQELGDLITEGTKIRDRAPVWVGDAPSDVTADWTAWTDKVEKFLKEKFDSAEVQKFRSLDDPNTSLNSKIHAKIADLEQLLDQVGH